MAKFLNTSGTNYFLEELIKNARERLILISPYLKLNGRVKELIADKDRLKIDVRMVYGKNELQPEEINWLKNLSYVRTSFCRNLHAKCYLNEESCIITSLNLYEFSQVNNNEMGVFISRSADGELYKETFEEAQRLTRISEEVRTTVERVVEEPAPPAKASTTPPEEPTERGEKLTTSKLAQKRGLKTGDLVDEFLKAGLLELRDGKPYLTDKGRAAGGEFRMSQKFGPFFIWPQEMTP